MDHMELQKLAGLLLERLGVAAPLKPGTEWEWAVVSMHAMLDRIKAVEHQVSDVVTQPESTK
jgi:hypothetical protein